MNKGINKNYAHLYPLLMVPFSVLLFIVFAEAGKKYAISIIVNALKIIDIKHVSIYLVSVIWLFMELLVIIAFIVLFRQIQIFSFSGNYIKGICIGWYIILISLFYILRSELICNSYQKAQTICFSVLYYILVAINEELIFRGIIATNTRLFLRRLLRKNVNIDFTSAITSALIFATCHITNILTISKRAVAIQMTGAMIIGTLLAIIYFKTKSLLSVIVLHAINDIGSAYPVIILNTGMTTAELINGYGIKDLIELIPILFILIAIFLNDSKFNKTEVL